MTFKYTAAIIFVAVGFSTAVTAQTYVEIGTTYPLSTDGNKYVVNGFISADGLTDEDIYANALLWTVENVCPKLMEGIKENSVSEKRFKCELTLASPADSPNKNLYHCQAIFQAAGGKLVYYLSDIKIESEGFVTKKVTPMEKLLPQKKETHRQTMEDFVKTESLLLNKLFDYVTTHPTTPIIHWKEISIRKPVKGMTEEECLLAFGKPQTITENNGEVQWMYSTTFHLFFENGKVNTIIK